MKAMLRYVIAALIAAGIISPLHAETSGSDANRQRVGLVLSGGGSKGIAEIGVLKALEDREIAIDYVTGTSMGAIVGSLYAMGYSPEEMMALIASKGFSDWSQGIIDQAYTYYMMEREPSPALFHLNVGKGSEMGSPLSLGIPTSLINPIPMSFAFMELFGGATAQCGRDFDKLFVPFRCVCSDVYHKHKIVCSEGSLGDAVRASMSFPLVFQPIEMDSVLVYDGGIYDNFPFDVMRDTFHPDIMIGVDVSGPNKKPQPGNLMSQLEDMIMQISDYNLPADEGIRIKIDLEQFGLLDFPKAPEIYAIGYAHGQAMADSICKRVTARTPASVLAARRAQWRSATPKLLFDSVDVHGVDVQQKQFLERIFRNHHKTDTFGIEQARSAFYRAVTPGRFRSLVPHAEYDSASGFFNLRLDASVKRSYDLAAGGYITSSANSFLYLSGTYSNLTSHYTYANLATWLGQSYAAAHGEVYHGLATPNPSSIGAEVAVMRQKLFENETFFYDFKTPTFITQSQFYVKLKYGVATAHRSAFYVGAGYAHMWDTFHPSMAAEIHGTGHDKTTYDLGQLYGKWSLSTLDNVNYPTRGSKVEARLAGVIGHVDYTSCSEEMPNQSRFISWAMLKAIASHYFPLHRHFSVGLGAEGIASTKPLLDNFNATMISAPEYHPTPSSYNVYNPGFRANSWVAGSVMPVWSPAKIFQLRGSFNGFVPARRIVEDPLTLKPRYSGWFDSVRFFGEAEAMITFPFATLSGWVNYRSYPTGDWAVGISLGLFHLAPKFF